MHRFKSRFLNPWKFKAKLYAFAYFFSREKIHSFILSKVKELSKTFYKIISKNVYKIISFTELEVTSSLVLVLSSVCGFSNI